MNYLRRKYMALMRGVNFRGYLRKASGYPLTLTDCMDSDIVSLSVAGNAVQDGTPSPDAPVEVVGVGDKTEPYGYRVPIECRGYNLVNVANFNQKFKGGTISDIDPATGSFKLVSKWGAYGIKLKKLFPDLEAGKEYYLFCNAPTAPQFCYLYGQKTTWIFGKKRTITQEDIDAENGFGIYGAKDGSETQYSNVMIIEASIYEAMGLSGTPPYEPYHHDTVNIYTDKPLYGVNGVPYEEKELTGNESWSKFNELTNTYAFVSGLGYSDWTYDKSYSNYFPRNSSVAYDEEGFTSGDESSRVYFRINKDRLNSEFTVDAWKAWLKEKYDSGNPVKVYFKKQTETQPQLNGQLHLQKGTNILTSTATVEPTGMTAEYYSSKEV